MSELISKQATQAQWDDIRSELRHREEEHRFKAKASPSYSASGRSAELAAGRAKRCAELIALLACLVLCACAGEQAPPPYLVFFDADVPQGDRDVFGAAAAEWNLGVMPADPVFWVGSEPARGRCGVEVVPDDSYSAAVPAESLRGACLMRILYSPGHLEPCVALHELTHKLLDEHVEGTVFAEHGCDYPAVVAPDLVARARARWGM